MKFWGLKWLLRVKAETQTNAKETGISELSGQQ